MKSDTVTSDEVSADVPSPNETATADITGGDDMRTAADAACPSNVDLGKSESGSNEALSNEALLDRAGAGDADSDNVRPDKTGADESGSDNGRSGKARSEKVGSDKVGSDKAARKRVADRSDETDSGSTRSGNDKSRWRPETRRVLLRSLLGVLVIALTVAVAVLAWQVKSHNDIDAAGRAAQDAAEKYAVALTSIDSQNLDSDFATVLDGATGAFKDMYGQSSTQLKQLLIDNNATGQGTVVDSAIKSASEDKAEILLFVDQTVTNSAAPEPRIDRSRVVMTMEKVDGRWLAAQVTLP